MPKDIIWVEDDVDVIYSAVRPLERAGYQIVVFRNVKDALEAKDQIREADLLLIDMLLPAGRKGDDVKDYQGLELLQKLRNEHNIKTPVIVFTVITKPVVLDELDKLDIAAIVRKPARPSELKYKVDQVLRPQE